MNFPIHSHRMSFRGSDRGNLLVQRQNFHCTVRRLLRCGSIGKIPSPGERVAPKGSGEEFGRQPAMTVNEKTFSSVASCVQPVQRSDMLYFISGFRPHSSSVMESVPKSRFHDSFPPGEAILGAPAPIRKTAPSDDRAVMWFCTIKASRRIAKTTDLAVRCNSSTNWNL